MKAGGRSVVAPAQDGGRRTGYPSRDTEEQTMPTALALPITPDTLLNDLMTAHMITIPILIRRGMMCVGCPVAGLHDVREACREHAIGINEFLAEINAAIGATTSGP
jgi:hybrid cluster-associated redox disulfide protein